MDAGHFVDAATTSFIASVGIGAAVVRRHWFLRAAVVGGVLALGLLIPAYEVVLEFAIQVAVISAGVALWRGATLRRMRISLKTILLAMVVAAVVAAVVGASPTVAWDTWTRIVFLGLTLGCMSLLSLWIACGRPSLRTRLVVGALGLVVFIAIFHFGIALRDTYYASQRGNDGWSYFVNCYRPDFLAGWLIRVAPGIVLGVITFTLMLMFARGSGWFTKHGGADDLASSGPLVKALCRVCLCGGFGTIAAANFFLLYKLCTPPPRLPENIPADNGYDDFLAAGKHKGADFSQIYSSDWRSWSDQELDRMVIEAQPAYDLIDRALTKECWATSGYSDDAQATLDRTALINVTRALLIRLEQLRRQDQWKQIAAQSCNLLTVGHNSSRGARSDYALDYDLEELAADHLRLALGALSSSECKELVAHLFELDQLREPMTVKVARSRQYMNSASWQARMQSLVREWNGQGDLYYSRLRDQLILASSMEAKLKLAIIAAALQAYWLDHDALPDSLAALVPEYLSAVPLDPFNQRPLRYKRGQGIYRVYSVERNGQDDGGVHFVGGQIGDLVFYGPHLPPVPYRWKRAAVEYASRAWATLKTVSNGAAAPGEAK
jgi:hypothetical protein